MPSVRLDLPVRPLLWLLVAAFGLTSTGRAERGPLPYQRLGVANGCFVESVALLDSFAETAGPDTWSRLLRWGASKDDEEVTGHAVAVVESGSALWCWDVNFGWKKLPTPLDQKDQVEAVSPQLTARYPDISPRFPELLQEFSQAPDPAPPGVPQTDVSAVRDAGIAAAALGRHRPVNAVQFTYGLDGEATVSGAVIFAYNGRMFVYTPDKGTFGSRARGSVHNARLVAEMLRRIFPGARSVEPLPAG